MRSVTAAGGVASGADIVQAPMQVQSHPRSPVSGAPLSVW